MDEDLRATATAAGSLGIDITSEIDAITAFLDGPPTVLVTGLPRTGKTRIADALASAVPEAVVLEHGLDDQPELWDVLVLLTPADRALSQAEQRLIEQARRRGLPVTVVVTRTDLLGPAREEAVDEITRLRLRPRLEPLKVRWWFTGLDQDAPDLGIQALIGPDAEAAHRPAVRAVLRRLLDSVAGRLTGRLELREREHALLAAAEERMPLVLEALAAVPASAAAGVADRFSTAENDVYEAAFETASEAVTWVATAGRGRWADVVGPLRAAWPALVQAATAALDAERARAHAEIRRLESKVLGSAAELGLSPVERFTPPPTWRTPESEDEIAWLATSTVNPVLDVLERTCLEEIEQIAKAAAAREGRRAELIAAVKARMAEARTTPATDGPAPRTDDGGRDAGVRSEGGGDDGRGDGVGQGDLGRGAGPAKTGRSDPGTAEAGTAHRGRTQRLAGLGGEARRLGDLLTAEARSALSPRLAESLPVRLTEELDLLLGRRYARLAETMRQAAELAAHEDAQAARSLFREQAEGMRAAVADRYAWSDAYGEILRLRAGMEGESPAAHKPNRHGPN